MVSAAVVFSDAAIGSRRSYAAFGTTKIGNEVRRMLYEPMGYIAEYEICALAFFIMIMSRYIAARRFPNQKNRLYSMLIWITIIDMVSDIISSYIIDNVFLVPLSVTYAVNGIFYLMQIILPILMMLYTLALVTPLDASLFRRILPLLLPGAAILLMLLSNPFTHWLFYVDEVLGYVHGERFILLYAAGAFYIAATLVVAIVNRGRLRPNEYKTICRFLAIVIITLSIQFFYPALLITGVGIAMSMIMMYFTIQNPETMLDTTTGAFTYEAMMTFLSDRVTEGDRVTLYAVKINNMGRINQLLGVDLGSSLLSQVSSFLSSLSNDCWVFRMRGSCFVAISRKPEDIESRIGQINTRIGEIWNVGSTEILLQATICVAATAKLLDEPITPEEAVNYLETVFLQNERAAERVRTIVIGQELLARIKRAREVESALREALEQGGAGLELYYQPIWSVKERRFRSAEVLLRFNHPMLGSISPEEFVPIAESNGFVPQMDEMVLRLACRFIRDHSPKELGLETLEINLSALEFMQRRLPELVNDIMSHYQVDPALLCFEITETAATESFELLRSCMGALCEMGCRFALDDFGTGYANISQVIQLPFSIVKLDRSLLCGSEIILRDISRMFDRMDMVTVIEGAETPEQAQLGEAIGIDYVQGYYYARPMNEEAFLQLLRDNAAADK